MNKKILIFLSILGISISLLISWRQLVFHYQVYFLSSHQHSLPSPEGSRNSIEKLDFSNRKIYSKSWVHRVDRIERYKYLLPYFEGFEVDIVFNREKNFLDVGHPPSESINLSFKDYLDVPGSPEKFFWLDIKNLDNENVAPFISCLNNLDRIFHIKHRLVIESGNMEPLTHVAAEGYFTSYYYQEEDFESLLKTGRKAFADSCIARIDAVSFDVEYLKDIKNLFPGKIRLTWALSIKNYFNYTLFRELDDDPLLMVYLVNIKSPYYR